MNLNSICVFCGSNAGFDGDYAAAAQQLGAAIVQRGGRLIFGGGGVGLMGAVADAVIAAGGEVIGVIPRALMTKELAHPRVADLRVVESMHERKALMAELADGFIALPGGYGTLDELCEVLTWLQLGIHRKPCGLLNCRDYFAGFLTFLDHSVREGFVREEHRAMLLTDTTAAGLLDQMASWQPIPVPKWLDLKQS